MKYFKSFITFTLIFLTCITLAQTPQWDWALSPDGDAISRYLTVNSQGDIFITGAFSDTLVFDSTIIISSTELEDFFIALYKGTGQAVWAKGAVGNYGDEGRCIITSSAGNVYVAGEFFSNSLSIDSVAVINNHITPYFNDATKDIFLAKFNSGGQLIWIVSGGGDYMEFVRGMTIDADENVTLVGTFWSASVTFGLHTLFNSGNIDAYIVRFDSSGQVLWAKNPIGDDEDNAYSIASDTIGNVYMAGSFRSNYIMFDNIELICSSDKFDTYLVKYDFEGNAVWAHNAVGSDWDEAKSVSIDKSGNIYLTGFFQSDSVSFDSVTLLKSMSNNIDMFLVKYSPDHQVLWAVRSGGNIWSWVYPEDIFVDLSGDIWVTGAFIGNGLEFGSIELSNYGSYDAYIVKYDKNGNVFWAESIGGNDMDFSEGIAADDKGHGYVSGFFESESIMFDSTALYNSFYFNKIFLAKKRTKFTSINPEDLRRTENISTTSGYHLWQSYPNPLNPNTKIKFKISDFQFTVLKVCDILGNEVATLVNEELPAGEYEVEFNPVSGIGDLASGIYFYQLRAGRFIETKKMILLK